MKTRYSHGLLQLYVGREALAYCQCLYRENKALFASVDLIGEKNQVILELRIKRLKKFKQSISKSNCKKEQRYKNKKKKMKIQNKKINQWYYCRFCGLVFQIKVKGHGQVTKYASSSILIFMLVDKITHRKPLLYYVF